MLALQVGCITLSLQSLHSSIHLCSRDIVGIAICLNAHYIVIILEGISREDESIEMDEMSFAFTTNVGVSYNIP